MGSFDMNFDFEDLQHQILEQYRENVTAAVESARCDEHPEERAALEWDAESTLKITGTCEAFTAKIKQRIAEITEPAS